MKIAISFSHDEVKGFKFGSWPFGKPVMFSHVYFFDGLLIDTGHKHVRKEVTQAVNALPVDQIFITHHHEDHTGNLGHLQEILNSPTYASSRCVEMMQTAPPVSLVQRLTWGRAKANLNIKPVDREIRTSNHQLEIIHIPGHAPDMVCLHLAERGWLFSADLWVSEYIRYFLEEESMKQQIDSIKKVLKYDFDVLFCGHNPQFKGGKQKLRNKLQFFEDFYGKVAELNKRGQTPNAIFKALELKEAWPLRIVSNGRLSTFNMVKSVIRDESA